MNSFVFSSFFSTMLLNVHHKDNLDHWTIRRGIKIFSKKMLIFPFHSDAHWSLFVVVNPGLVQAGYLGRRTHKEIPFILHLDSLGGNSPHTKSTFGRTIRWWLNRVWKLESDKPYENTLPFNKSRCKYVRVAGKSADSRILRTFQILSNLTDRNSWNIRKSHIFLISWQKINPNSTKTREWLRLWDVHAQIHSRHPKAPKWNVWHFWSRRSLSEKN